MLLLVMCFAGCQPATPGKLVIVKDGIPRADIVIANTPPRTVKLAALELQTYIEKMSGARLPITTRAQTNVAFHIYVGKSSYTDRLKITDEGLKCGAFRMVAGNPPQADSQAGWLVLLGHDGNFVQYEPTARGHLDKPRVLKEWDAITGKKWNYPFFTYRRYSPAVGVWDYDERGSLYAVYEFLENLGVRWYMPGDLGEIVPKRKTIAISPEDKIVKPDFQCRNLGGYSPHFDCGPRDSILWRLRMRFSMGHEFQGHGGVAHRLNLVHGRKEVQESHPEYFALYNGKRHTKGKYYSPCLSAPGLLDSTVKFARFIFDRYTNEPAISVMPNDGYVKHCQCDLCKGKDTPERGHDGKMSDYVWDFVNRVAIELYKTHPDKKVINIAYGSHRMPPEKITKFSPNVVVGIVQGRLNFHDPKYRARMVAAREAFRDKATPGNMFTTDHYLYSRPGRALEGIPVYFPHIIAEDLHSLKGQTYGEFIELSQGPGSAMHAPGFNHLNVYVTSRYYWDAEQDINKLLDEYYKKFYGPAAKEMKAFIEYSEINWPLIRTKIEIIDKTLALLDAARKAADDTVYGKRIDLVRDYVRPLKELRSRLAMDRKDVPKKSTWDRNESEIKIDGQLNDPCWTNGSYGWRTYASSLAEVETGRRAFSGTSFRVVWIGKTICFGIHSETLNMKDLNITTTNNDDTALLKGDFVDVLLETQGHSYYQIAVNPAGTIFDADMKGGTNTAWSSSAEVAVYKGDKFWNVEMRIPVGDAIEGGVDPMKCVEGRCPSALYPWFINVCRQQARSSETRRSAWSPTGRNTFYVPVKFGELLVR